MHINNQTFWQTRAALLALMVCFGAFLFQNFLEFNEEGRMFLPNWAWGIFAASAIFVLLACFTESRLQSLSIYLVLQLPVMAMLTSGSVNPLIDRMMPVFAWGGLLSAVGAAIYMVVPPARRLLFVRDYH